MKTAACKLHQFRQLFFMLIPKAWFLHFPVVVVETHFSVSWRFFGTPCIASASTTPLFQTVD